MQCPPDQLSEENRQKMLDQIYGDLQLAENDFDPEFKKAAYESCKKWERDHPGQSIWT
jgi:hypothetical protein